jgi:molybdopterin synthase sulfur carrier subunit
MLAKVRLFAQARDAAGCREVEVDATTVGEAVAELSRRFGPAFQAVLATSTIWLNGEVVPAGHAVTPGDEVAVLPPVSGG